ncbi:MAG: thiamine diphosphokinase [Clostridia bacterium]|nr:thiamine diphosphokinase [Clostridia bacterium]
MKKLCVIFGAGEYYGCETLPAGEFSAVTADGGCKAAKRMGVTPEFHIGDFDSCGGEPVTGCEIVRLKPEKDLTDTRAAIELAISRGAEEFLLLGCTGGRTAHTVANIQTLASLARRGYRARMVGNGETFACVHDGTVRFSPGSTGYVSVFALSGKCTGVTEKGLKYELTDAALKDDDPIGVSNEFTGAPAEIGVKRGTLLIIYGNGGIEA